MSKNYLMKKAINVALENIDVAYDVRFTLVVYDDIDTEDDMWKLYVISTTTNIRLFELVMKWNQKEESFTILSSES